MTGLATETPGTRDGASPASPLAPLRLILTAGALFAAWAWAYADTLSMLATDWRHDPNYSAGALVPAAALYLVWTRRRELADCPIRPCWWGVAALAAAQAARWAGMLFLYESVERYAMILAVAALVLLVGGWRLLWRLKWVLAFLLLMIPLPGRVHNAVSGPLQDLAAAGAVFMLALAGVSVVREGATMLLNGSVPLAVAEACNGLRMLTAFVMVAAVLAAVVRRPLWQKTVLLVSGVPVAIACNLARLFVTAMLYVWIDGETAERFFHDFAGVAMMPLAAAMLAGELWLTDRVVQSEPSKAPV